MKYRKQTQHIRRYRSGRYTFVNRGVRYWLNKASSYDGITKRHYGTSTKVISLIKDNPLLAKYNIIKDGKIMFSELRGMASNHVFDDNPSNWGITKDEADTFRSFMQHDVTKKGIIDKLKKDYLNIFDFES